jgi:dephospho-CoA kinase
MKNIIAVGGEPATGKTTLMWRIIDSATDWQKIEPKKTLSAIRSESLNLTILGKYDRSEQFAGTDRLSMSVQPAATEFIKEVTSPGQVSGNILFEGDRLFNRKFIDAIISCDCSFSLIYIEASRNELHNRHVDRKDTQTETFLKSRQTKYSNIVRSLDLMDIIHTFKNDNLDHQKIIYDFIISKIV